MGKCNSSAKRALGSDNTVTAVEIMMVHVHGSAFTFGASKLTTYYDNHFLSLCLLAYRTIFGALKLRACDAMGALKDNDDDIFFLNFFKNFIFEYLKIFSFKTGKTNSSWLPNFSH